MAYGIKTWRLRRSADNSIEVTVWRRSKGEWSRKYSIGIEGVDDFGASLGPMAARWLAATLAKAVAFVEKRTPEAPRG